MRKAILFFDLFFTLIEPIYNNAYNENDVLGISVEEWETIAEDHDLYHRRAIGTVKDPRQIIAEIVSRGGYEVSLSQKKQLLELRVERIRSAFQNVDGIILSTLFCLKEKGHRLCIISNADAIDKVGWSESPLFPLFDTVIFSCDVGYIKPQPHIYQLAMEKMRATPRCSYFIGDGGSNELFGAKSLGMKTVLSEHLCKRTDDVLTRLLTYADFHVRNFNELLGVPYNN